MSDEELMKFIEDVEKHKLHKAPDYLKEITIKKSEARLKKDHRTKAEQLFYYKIRVFAAMAASLLLLFVMPQPQKKQEISQPVTVMRTVYQKSNELCEFLNQFSKNLVSREEF